MTVMNILVVGGAGYIGSATSQLLIEAGHTVTVFDNLSRGHREAVPAAANFIRGDLANPQEISDALAQSEAAAVLHFAALIEAGESMVNPAKYFRANVGLTINLLEACANHQIEKFVFSSTAAVFAASDDPISETSVIAPANAYGETKLIVEKMLRWFGEIHEGKRTRARGLPR